MYDLQFIYTYIIQANTPSFVQHFFLFYAMVLCGGTQTAINQSIKLRGRATSGAFSTQSEALPPIFPPPPQSEGKKKKKTKNQPFGKF